MASVQNEQAAAWFAANVTTPEERAAGAPFWRPAGRERCACHALPQPLCQTCGEHTGAPDEWWCPAHHPENQP